MLPSLPESPRHDDLRGHLLELYARTTATPVPPDQLVARYFRLRRNLPPGARAFLGATVYALLRRRIRTLLLHQWAGRESANFDWPDSTVIPPVLAPFEEAALALCRWMMEDIAAPADKAVALARAALEAALARPLPEGEFEPPPLGNPHALLKGFAARISNDPQLANAPEELRRSASLSMPHTILARWSARFGAKQADALARAMGETAPLDIRVNRLRGTREQCAERLRALGSDSTPTQWSTDGLRLAAKANLFRTTLFEEGWFEVQDEGSQLVAFALDPRPGWRVLDACSGGGGKSLHLGALMKNRGEIFAHDLDASRLENQRKRLRRAGLHNVRLLEPGTAAQHAPYDAVLIDAPCLGFGTLRRNPDMAWRAPLAQRLDEMTAIQRECLREYGALLKPGGVLVYATCSLEPEETTALVENIGAIVPDLAPSPLLQPFEHHAIAGLARGKQWTVTLLPSVHSTDGFFIARLQRAG